MVPSWAGTSYGAIRIGRAGGDLRLDTACGDITVGRAGASVSATTRYGQIRVGQAAPDTGTWSSGAADAAR